MELSWWEVLPACSARKLNHATCIDIFHNEDDLCCRTHAHSAWTRAIASRSIFLYNFLHKQQHILLFDPRKRIDTHISLTKKKKKFGSHTLPIHQSQARYFLYCIGTPQSGIGTMSVNNQEDNNNPFGHLELEPETEDYDGHDITTHHKKDQSNNTQTNTGVSDPTVSTTTTSRTTIDVSSHHANPTQQQQPQQQKQKQQERHEQQDEDDAYYQLMDVSDKATAWAIHICLIVFAVIVIVAVVLAFLAIESYGVVAIVAISMIVLALGGLGWFVHSIVQDDHRLRPIRREIHSWTKVIQQIVQDEMDAFYDEWQDEYKLLTYGDVSSTKDGTQQQQQQHPTNQKSLDEPSSLDCDPSNSISMPSPRRKRKSVLFTMIPTLVLCVNNGRS